MGALGGAVSALQAHRRSASVSLTVDTNLQTTGATGFFTKSAPRQDKTARYIENRDSRFHEQGNRAR
jgi:hypothetical protein